MKTKHNHFLPGALALYFSYAMLGIASSILSQYKAQFAANWGAQQLSNGTIDVSMVVSVIAAFGLGRLIAYPFAGPVSDHFGRKVSGTIGIALYSFSLWASSWCTSSGQLISSAFLMGWQTRFWTLVFRRVSWRCFPSPLRLRIC